MLEKIMNIATRIAAAVLFAVSAVPATSQTADPRNICLNALDVRRTETPDDHTILFHMRDGKVWRNTLKTVCPMLKVSPFTEVLQTGQICANQQIIHVALTGNTCVLGGFTPVLAGR